MWISESRHWSTILRLAKSRSYNADCMNPEETMDMDKFADSWLDREVEFTLLGQKIRGKVREVIDTICAPRHIVAEFRDGNKQVKVVGPYQAFRRL